MPQSNKRFTRRNFLSSLALACAAPLLPRSVQGIETTATAANAGAVEDNLLRIVTANILATLEEHDGTPVDWETQRKDVCFKVLKDQHADIICLQEVMRSQFHDFQAGFPEYSAFGYEGPYMDRNPKRFKSIKNVILFLRERYQMTSAGSYTLSKTPLIEGSNSWSDNIGRHVNWVRLKDLKSGTEFRVLNTHLAVHDQTAREESAKLIAAESGQYTKDFPQILAGDFNATIKNKAIALIKVNGWVDSYAAVHGDADPGSTGHGYTRLSPEEIQAQDVQIDWIFYRGKIKPAASQVIRDQVGGQYPSDHFFVSADFKI